INRIGTTTTIPSTSSISPYFPLALSAAFMASSSASTFSDDFSSAISSSVLFGPVIPSASARPSAKSARRSSTSKRLNASSVRLPFMISRARARVTALSKRAAIAFWRARFAQLALELGDVDLIALQRVVDDSNFFAQALGHVGCLLALDQGGLGKILAILRQRE